MSTGINYIIQELCEADMPDCHAMQVTAKDWNE